MLTISFLFSILLLSFTHEPLAVAWIELNFISKEDLKLKVSTIHFSLGAINGGWSAYSQWGVCSEVKYCLQGIKKRTRSCNNPFPANGGDECTGTKEEEKICPTLEDGCTSELIYSFLS